MATIAPGIVSKLRRKFHPKHEVKVEDEGHLAEMTHWIEPRPLRMAVPVGLLRMHGAFRYEPGHPFIDALTLGQAALEAFYATVQPATVREYYGLEATGRVGEDLPPWEIPWRLRLNRLPPAGERGLGPEHGVSFYGPVTKEKVALEYRRLTKPRDAIRAKGYDPDGHGDIRGHVIRDGNRAVFAVVGGKHRAAILAAQGWTHVPVCFHKRFPRLVDRAQVPAWPLVRSGEMAADLAADILSVYIAGRGGQTHIAGRSGQEDCAA